MIPDLTKRNFLLIIHIFSKNKLQFRLKENLTLIIAVMIMTELILYVTIKTCKIFR